MDSGGAPIVVTGINHGHITAPGVISIVPGYLVFSSACPMDTGTLTRTTIVFITEMFNITGTGGRRNTTGREITTHRPGANTGKSAVNIEETIGRIDGMTEENFEGTKGDICAGINDTSMSTMSNVWRGEGDRFQQDFIQDNS